MDTDDARSVSDGVTAVGGPTTKAPAALVGCDSLRALGR